MHRASRPFLLLDPTALASLMTLGASFFWGMAILSQWSRLTALGGLCSEAVGLIGHCWACYPAVALSLAAMTLAGLAFINDSQPEKIRGQI